MERGKWLVLSYSLPAEPSRHRVAAWRSLKKLGALSTLQSLWILPDTAENRTSLGTLGAEIGAAGGDVLLLESAIVHEAQERRIVASFNALRDAEYAEFTSECRKYLAEIEKEIAKEKFIFAELEEEEAELEKLVSWHARIAARDLFGAAGAPAAAGLLAQIRSAFDGFSSLVYARENGAGESGVSGRNRQGSSGQGKRHEN